MAAPARPGPAFPAALAAGAGGAEGMRPQAAAALLCALCCALARGSEDIVVGCGGFVKSDVEINYSLIEVGAAAPSAAGPGCLPGVPGAAVRAAVTGGGGAAALLQPGTLQPACHKPCPAAAWHGCSCCCCVTALG